MVCRHTAMVAAMAFQLGAIGSGCAGAQTGAGDPTIVVEDSSILIFNDSSVSTPAGIPFEVDSHVLQPASHRPLDALADFLKVRDDYELVEVQGHSDERGSEQYNLRLSQRRAESVIHYLVGQGVERSRLRAKGFGANRPAVDGTNESAWSQNRRVEFVIVAQAPGTGSSSPGVQEY